MKHLFLLPTLFLLFLMHSYAQEYVPDSNTIVLLHFNESSGSIAYDASSNHNDATGTGTIVPGIFGNARSFNGSTEYFSIPNSPSMGNLTQITIDLWVKPISFYLGAYGSGEGLVWKGDDPTDISNHFELTILRNENLPNYAATSFDSLRFRFRFGNAILYSRWYLPNNWYHVVATYDGNTAKLYVNGILDNTLVDSGQYIVNNYRSLNINRHTWSNEAYSSQRMGGMIDEIHISKIARQPWEFNFSLTQGLVAYYPFNGNANDESGKGHDGTVNGAILTTDRLGNTEKAFSFNGIENNIIVPQSIPIFNLGWTEFSISGWFNSSDLSKTDQNIFNTLPHNGISIDLNYYSRLGVISYCIGNGSTWDSAIIPGIKSDYQANTWYLMTLVKHDTTYDFFINGILDKSIVVPISRSYNVDVGCRFGTIGPHPIFGSLWQMFKGKLDDYRIYDRALIQLEIDSLYHEGGWNPTTTGSVSGIAFNDLNSNGVKDIGEPGLQNWFIGLFEQDLQVDSTITDASGVYTFTSVQPDTYTVRERMISGWMQTMPSTGEYANIIIVEDTVIIEKDFGNFHLGIISGEKFKDINGNGVKDIDEPKIPNWLIRINGMRNDSVLTDTEGNYQFSDLQPGIYTISEEIRPGWQQTYPTNQGYYVDTISTSGENRINRDFGNHIPVPKIKLGLTFYNADKSASQTIYWGIKSGAGYGIWRVDPNATSIDSTEGESELPPIMMGAFDIRFINPDRLPNLFGNGSWNDFRNIISETQRDTFKISFQPGPVGYPVTFKWSKELINRSFNGDVRIGKNSSNWVDMKTEDSLVIENVNTKTLYLISESPSLPIIYGKGWNIVSIPVNTYDGRDEVIFPTASSYAYKYNPIKGYEKVDTLVAGVGYWVKFSSILPSLTLDGEEIPTIEIDVKSGWNLIGGLNQDIPVNTIQSIPVDIVVGSIFGFQDGYQVADALKPYFGYWVKVKSDGKIILTK
jgi:hypothetical protein